MSDAVAAVGVLIWLAVVGACWAHARWINAAPQLQLDSRCTRCATALDVEHLQESGGRVTMCPRCLRITQRNYRLGSWTFYAIACFFCVIGPFVIRSELRQFGTRTALLDAALMLVMAGGTAAAAWAIRHFGSRVR